MNGRDFICYILENGLENRDIYEILFTCDHPLTVKEAAQKFEVGEATIQALVQMKQLDGFVIKGELRIPENAVIKKSNVTQEEQRYLK